MKKVILLNVVFFVVLMLLFIIAAFSMGYAPNNRFGTDAGILFILVVVIHLFLNYLLMHRSQPPFSKRAILLASAGICCLYLLIIFH